MLSLWKKKRPRDYGQDLAGLLENYQLPSFPVAMMNVLGKLRDPNTEMHTISTALQVDPGMSVKTLQTVNSVAFGLSTKVANLRHAVTLLGRSRLEALVLSVAARETLDSNPAPAWFDRQRFWKVAARRAAIARCIAGALHPATQGEAFTGGLLQDMAVPVMADIHQTDYQSLYETWQKQPELGLCTLEKERFGHDHTDFGSAMGRRWDFPDNLTDLIASHHGDANSEPELGIRIAALLHSPDQSSKDLLSIIETVLHLDPARFAPLVEQGLANAEDLFQAMG